MREPIRVLCAMAVVTCLVALMLMPGALAAIVVQSHSSGKQSVRFISVLTILAFAAALCQGLLRVSSFSLHSFRQVYLHGFGPALIDKTCVRLC